MNAPKRLQRKRTKGWRMPEGAVYVGRPSRWGNPFWWIQRFYGLELSLGLYEDMVHGIWSPGRVAHVPNIDGTYKDREDWLKRIGGHPTDVARSVLAGRDLVCWCPLDQPCHADVLLEMANV